MTLKVHEKANHGLRNKQVNDANTTQDTRLTDVESQLSGGSGVSGTFTTVDAKTVTVTDGIITNIV